MQFLEIGKIVNTHGIRGELKVMPWCDSAEFFCDFETLYLDEKTPLKVLKTRIHKNAVLVTFEGINDINVAEQYKNRILYIDRDDAEIDEDTVFLQDMIDCVVFDEYLGRELGKIIEVRDNPAHDILVIQGEKEHLVPFVDEFVLSIDIEEKKIVIKTIEGMI